MKRLSRYLFPCCIKTNRFQNVFILPP